MTENDRRAIRAEQIRVLTAGHGNVDCQIGDADTITVTHDELWAGILVGIAGESDPVPTQEQCDRTVKLIFRTARRSAAAPETSQ